MSEADPAARVRRAREVQKEWAERTLAARVRALAKAKRRLLAKAGELVAALQEEREKPKAEALFSEIVPSGEVFDYWLRAIEELVGPIDVELSPFAYSGKSGRTTRTPRGVIALITPSSYPVAIPVRTMVPALLAGNAVVWKPSPRAPKVATIVAAAFEGVLPDGLLTKVDGDGVEGDAIIAAGVDSVVFAGHAGTARRVLAACAKELTPASLELDGKDAAIVLDDAKLERAARGIVWGAFTNAGRSAASIQRVYVEKGIAPKLIARVTALAKSLEPAREVVQIEDDDVELPREPALSPTLSVVVVDGLEAAAERVRASRYGLTTSVWTRSLERSSEIAARIGTPVVTFNCHGVTSVMPEAPWGGRGESGFGVTNGPLALDALTRPRFILEDRSLRARDMYWYPYTPSLERAGVALVRVRGGASLLGRVPAFFSLIAALVKRFFER